MLNCLNELSRNANAPQTIKFVQDLSEFFDIVSCNLIVRAAVANGLIVPHVTERNARPQEEIRGPLSPDPPRTKGLNPNAENHPRTHWPSG